MPDRDAAIARARKLLLLSFYNDNANERRSAHAQVRKLIVEHDIKHAEILGAAAAKAWGVEDFVRAGEAGREVLTTAREVLADPEVQKTVAAVRDIGTGVANFLRKRRGS